jgi:hypothetical protein
MLNPPNHFCGVAGDDAPRLNVACDDSASGHNRILPNNARTKDNGPGTNPCAVLDPNISPIRPRPIGIVGTGITALLIRFAIIVRPGKQHHIMSEYSVIVNADIAIV